MFKAIIIACGFQAGLQGHPMLDMNGCVGIESTQLFDTIDECKMDIATVGLPWMSEQLAKFGEDMTTITTVSCESQTMADGE